MNIAEDLKDLEQDVDDYEKSLHDDLQAYRNAERWVKQSQERLWEAKGKLAEFKKKHNLK